jgi:hypothetical protein
MPIHDDRNRFDREAGVQGPRWHSVHEGYFAHAAIARPFVEAVRRAAVCDTEPAPPLAFGERKRGTRMEGRGARNGF